MPPWKRDKGWNGAMEWVPLRGELGKNAPGAGPANKPRGPSIWPQTQFQRRQVQIGTQPAAARHCPAIARGAGKSSDLLDTHIERVESGARAPEGSHRARAAAPAFIDAALACARGASGRSARGRVRWRWRGLEPTQQPSTSKIKAAQESALAERVAAGLGYPRSASMHDPASALAGDGIRTGSVAGQRE